MPTLTCMNPILTVKLKVKMHKMVTHWMTQIITVTALGKYGDVILLMIMIMMIFGGNNGKKSKMKTMMKILQFQESLDLKVSM